MSEKIFEELKQRRQKVEFLDQELRTKNREKFLQYLLHMTILSSAIVVGVLPLINDASTAIKSVLFAKIGLALIVSVCVIALLYLHNILNRERILLSDQQSFHDYTFSSQYQILSEAKTKGANDDELYATFEKTKSQSSIAEQELVLSHLVGGRFSWLRQVRDSYINTFITYGFATGVILIILSFID